MSQEIITGKEVEHDEPSTKSLSDFQINTPGSSPKRNLRPVSPHKNGNATVGRLSFLQSDNIDEHFEHIHGSHEEIMKYLQLLEAQTQQTQEDIDQLFDRLKNNNQNLTKLLSSIADYSREVTEEGNATKTDVGKILNALKDLRDTQDPEKMTRHFNTKQEEVLRELRLFMEKSQNSEATKRASENQVHLLNKLLAIETQLSGLKVQNTFGEFRSRVESLAQENSKQVNAKLAEVLQSLEKLNLTEKSQKSEDLLNGLVIKFSNQMDQSMARFESLLQSQSKTIENFAVQNVLAPSHSGDDWEQKQTELQKDYDNLSNKYKNLESSYTDLETRYAKLQYYYDAKLQLFSDLESKFVKLGEDSKELHDSISNFDATKYDKVQELHSNKVRDLRNVTPLQRNTRIISMPSQNSFTRDNISNNSDIEE